MMNEKLSEKEDFPLDDFKRAIAGLKKREEEHLNENGLRKTAHFEDLDPNELSEADMLIYQMLLDKQLSTKELDLYRDQLQKSGNQSQKKFSAYIANMLFLQMYKKKE